MVIFVEIVLFHVMVENSRIWVVFRVERNPAVDNLLGSSFIDRIVKGIFPPEEKIMAHYSAPVPTVAAVIKTEDKQDQDKQKGGIIEKVTGAG